MRTRPGPTRAVLETGFALVQVAVPPLRGDLARDVHRLRRGRDGPPGLDPLAQPQPAFGREGSVSVQGGLLGSCVAFDSSTLAQGPLTQPSTTSQGTTPRPRSVLRRGAG